MDYYQQLKIICDKELEFRCYDPNVCGVSLYSLVREEVRNSILSSVGIYVMNDRNKINFKSTILSLIQSAYHLIKLFCFGKSYKTVFYPFARVDRVGGLFMDKFSDPIIDECELEDYIIFDRGRAGAHPQPRAHKDHIVFIDLLQVAMTIKTLICYRLFIKKHKEEFDLFRKSLKQLMGKDVDESILKMAILTLYYSKAFGCLLKKVKAKNVIGPARGQQRPAFIAAKKLGIRTMELQHGVTYSDSVLYSGYRDPIIVPDFFLAYGDNNPKDVYGIDENKIVNVGFAFLDYFNGLVGVKKYGDKDVLFISDPGITEKLVSIICRLATDNPKINFYFRPHPQEIVSDEQKYQMCMHRNVFIQDISINIIEMLYGFNYVVGESSSVLYEALAMNKMVGRLHYDGLNPMYLSDNDRRFFWQISNQIDFEDFLQGVMRNNVRSIYSKFDKKKIIELLN